MQIDLSKATPAMMEALASAQSKLGSVFKDATNPAFKSKYASLAAVEDAVLPSFNACGLAVMHMPYNADDNAVGVVCVVTHKDGGSIQFGFAVKPAKFDAQGAGSAITYLRRYTLMAVSGVAPEDDDGNAASAGAKPAKVIEAPALNIEALMADIAACESQDDLTALYKTNSAAIMKHQDKDKILVWFGDRKALLAGATDE